MIKCVDADRPSRPALKTLANGITSRKGASGVLRALRSKPLMTRRDYRILAITGVDSQGFPGLVKPGPVRGAT